MTAISFSTFPVRQILQEGVLAHQQYGLAVRRNENPLNTFVSFEGLQLCSRQILPIAPNWARHVPRVCEYLAVGGAFLEWMCPKERGASAELSLLQRQIQCLHIGISWIARATTPFLRVATLVTVVALFYFGYSLRGVLGVTAWVLFELKRKKLLPALLDRQLQKIGIVGEFVSVFSPGFWAFRVLRALEFGSCLITHMPVERWRRRYAWLRNPLLGKHLYQPWNQEHYRSWSLYLQDLSRWQMNQTHIHAEEVAQIWPSDIGNPVGIDALIRDFEAWVGEYKNINQAGFAVVKEFVLRTTTDRAYPENPDAFMDYLRKMLWVEHQRLQARVPQKREKHLKRLFARFTRLKNLPTHEWLSYLSGVVRPHSRALPWEVHASLSRFRQGCLDKMIREQQQAIQDELVEQMKEAPQVLKNLSIVIEREPVHRAMHHVFRTHFGEIALQMQPSSLLETICKRWFLLTDGTSWERASFLQEMWNDSFCNGVYAHSVRRSVPFPMTGIRIECMKEVFDMEATVVFIQQEFDRQHIRAKAIRSWKTDFCQRVGLTERQFRELYLDQSHVRSKIKLNSQGIILLLADLGVLEIQT